MPQRQSLNSLSWSKDDIEQRLFFRGGRFTRVNGWLTFLIGGLLTLVFYGVLSQLPGDYLFVQMFLERGPTQYATALLAFWSLAILFIKWRKLALQRRALDYIAIPEQHDFVLSPTTVDQVLQRILASVDDPKQFVLFNRMVLALSNLRNLGQVSDVDDILRSQADQDEASMETSYLMLTGFVWAIPVLGFIGTVLGLSEAIGAFSGVLGSAKEMNEISGALKGVTAGLATAFDTTLVALVAALVIQLALTWLKKSEQEFLDECSEYCSRHLVSRLRLLPYEQVEVR